MSTTPFLDLPESVRDSTYLLNQETHWESLVQHPQFPIFTLLVIWVTENTSVKQCSVNISYHRSDIPGRIRFVVGRVFDRVEVFVGGLVEMLRVSFVERVDFTSVGDLDLRVG